MGCISGRCARYPARTDETESERLAAAMGALMRPMGAALASNDIPAFERLSAELKALLESAPASIPRNDVAEFERLSAELSTLLASMGASMAALDRLPALKGGAPQAPADGRRDREMQVALAASPGMVEPALLDTVIAAFHDRELTAAERAADYSLEGRRLSAKVVDVYDGDTIRVVFRGGAYDGPLVQYRARMAGYDSPELHPRRAAAGRVAEAAAGRAAKEALAGCVLGRCVALRCGPFDKYGRLLVTVYAPLGDDQNPGARATNTNINEWMVAHGHGVPYDGGAKPSRSQAGGVA